MKSRRRALVWITVILVVLAAAGFGAVMAMNRSPLTVATATLARRSMVARITINGAVSADAVFETMLGSAQKVVAVHKKAGDTVKAGDLLVELDTADLMYQLGKAELGLEQLKASTANARAQAQISLSTAQLALTQARANHSDVLDKYDDGRVTKLVRDQSATALKTAENQVRLAQAVYDSLDVDSAASDRRKQIDAASLDIENLRRKIADSAIKTTIAGTVTALDARPGQFPGQQTSFIQVVDLSQQVIQARVDQYDAVQLKPGQKVRFSVKGLAGELGGSIEKVDSVATAQGSAGAMPKYPVRIQISPPAPGSGEAGLAAALKPGYEVDVRVSLQELPNAQALPQSAVAADAGGPYVLVVRAGAAVRQPVQTGLESEGWVEIKDGLTQEDLVITNPPRELKAGVAVKAG